MIIIVKLINISPRLVTIFVCVMTASEIYSLSKFALFNTVSLSAVTLYLDPVFRLFILPSCYFLPFNQHLSLSLTSMLLVTHILLSASLCFMFLDCIYS